MRGILAGLAVVGLGFGAGAASASTVVPGWQTVFSDSFSHIGAPAAPWEVRNAGASVDGNRMRLQSPVGGPRNALVTAFAGSASLRNYQLNVTVDPVEGLNRTSADILLRADANAYLGSDGGARGSFYQVSMFNNIGTAASSVRGNGPVNYLQIDKGVNGVSAGRLLSVFIHPLVSPYDLSLKVKNSDISVSINGGAQSFYATDVVNPLTAGGIGLHTLWEAAADFDNVEILAPVPLPAGAFFGLTGLVALGSVAWRKSRRRNFGS